jgi:Rps23 Pro-64 3,4-dihydroxylase Tpa1-like proline 4-hydroxylase
MHIADKQLLTLSNNEVFTHPFPYFVSPQALSSELSFEILTWLENDAPWKLVETDFYEQYEFSFFDAQLPNYLKFLTSPEYLAQIKNHVESLFSVKLDARIDFTAHKLIPGQRIRIHNDYIPGCETHRLLIQLNKGWDDDNGGMLMFFNSQNPSDIHKIFRPSHNSSVGFAISPDSHHAVSIIHKGERYTIIFSFYKLDEQAP